MMNLTVFATELAACFSGNTNGINTFLTSDLWVNYGSKAAIVIGIVLVFKGMWGLVGKLFGRGASESLGKTITYMIAGVGLSVGSSAILGGFLGIFGFLAGVADAILGVFGVTC